MTAALNPSSSPALRPASALMRLARMGAAFPTRLSFMRILLRNLAADGAQVRRTHWDMDDQGYGTGVYSLTFGGHDYSLVAVSTALADEDRSDRVIAEAWDAAFVLFDGLPNADDLARIAATAPHQEACRYSQRELTLSRANKSERLFQHVVEALSKGDQPDETLVDQIGYLMRTTAVYGNGKFGIADRANFAARPFMAPPFQAEMLTVWLIRAFTHDLVEHMAARRNPETAAKLDPRLKRHLGIGNATGLGMAPFLVSHPTLLHAWVTARETALARILDLEGKPDVAARADRIAKHLAAWNVDDTRQMARIETLRAEFARLDFQPQSWRAFWQQTDGKSHECQELVQALMIDAVPEASEDLAEALSSDTPPAWFPAETVGKLQADTEQAYGWALKYDFSDARQTALFWYTSEEKLEPRLGHRYEEPGADKERPLDIARQVQGLHAALRAADPAQRLAFFFVDQPQHRAIAARIQTCRDLPYAEIQDNLIAETTLPIDMLRFKLAMFGASKFDPKSNLWTRITLFQGAPLIDDADLGADWGFAAL